MASSEADYFPLDQNRFSARLKNHVQHLNNFYINRKGRKVEIVVKLQNLRIIRLGASLLKVRFKVINLREYIRVASGKKFWHIRTIVFTNSPMEQQYSQILQWNNSIHKFTNGTIVFLQSSHRNQSIHMYTIVRMSRKSFV